KMACGDPKARFRAVVLDPELLASAPRRVLAAAGIDALSHVVESYVCTARNPVSALYGREAFGLLVPGLPALLADPADPVAAGQMLWGAHLAGAAIEQSMLGIAHSCANPLTARLGFAHGAAVGRMLPTVVRFNGAVVEALYGELLAAVGVSVEAGAAARLAGLLEELLALSGLDQRLSSWGLERGHLEALGTEAAEQWTARFNPRPVTARELIGLYEEVW
ncbi:MAG: iron-containing alcohol dehydrogenase, partial [Acidobacteria bacterium]|nr:iron-containing alcohol dehydrogenase [Acidobacteriota bacterium]